MTDRELLELAAKAAGYKNYISDLGRSIVLYDVEVYSEVKDRRVTAEKIKNWNPLDDDGDALRLAVKLDLFQSPRFLHERDVLMFTKNTPKLEATRRAIVRAAAEIGRNTK